jgi:hypothetical protein
MKEMINALLNLETVNFIRYRLLIEALERKGVVTRSELDAAYVAFPDSEKDATHTQTKRLFLDTFAEFF